MSRATSLSVPTVKIIALARSRAFIGDLRCCSIVGSKRRSFSHYRQMSSCRCIDQRSPLAYLMEQCRV
jgi:hypothetical protein